MSTEPTAAPGAPYDLADAFEQLPVGVAIFDTSDAFRCLRHNMRFLPTIGASARAGGSVVGAALSELLAPESYGPTRLIFEQVRAAGLPFASDDYVARMEWEPEPRFFQWSLTPLRGADGAVSALLASGIEITARKVFEAEARVMARRADEERALLDTQIRAMTMRERERAADLEALLHAVPAAVWIAHDPLCQMITGSRAASLMLRMAPDSNLSKTATNQVDTTHFRVMQRGVELAPEDLPVQQAARGIEVHDFEEDVVFDDGTTLTLLGNATPLRDDKGQLRGAVAAFLDITERKHAEQERARLYAAEQQARAEAESALKIRDTFFAMAAHELKTPLTALLGQVQLIERRAAQSGTLSERDQRAVQAVVSQASRLNKLIDAMLDLTRIERGYLSLEREPVDIVALAHGVLDEIQPIYPRHQFRWIGSATPIMVSGDVMRLEQVLYNLIENAVKYSPHGGEVTVRVELRDSLALIDVCDQGIGIPSADIPHLFERFFRAEGASRRHISGMGIGLYVVREIVTLHGGEVHVKSTEGEGSCFSVTLPLVSL